jgi:hypothetical protein
MADSKGMKLDFDALADKQRIRNAMIFALKNINEIAIPMADELGKVTSFPHCATMLKEAIEIIEK